MQHKMNDHCLQMPNESRETPIPPRFILCPPLSYHTYMTRDMGGLCVCVYVCMYVYIWPQRHYLFFHLCPSEFLYPTVLLCCFVPPTHSQPTTFYFLPRKK